MRWLIVGGWVVALGGLGVPLACSGSDDSNGDGNEPAEVVETSRTDSDPDAPGAAGSEPDDGDSRGMSPGNGNQEGAPDPAGLVGGEDDGTGGGPGGDDDPGAGEAPPDEPPPVVASVCPPGPFAESPLSAASTPQPVCTGMGFTEGAVWFAERNTLYFSDIVFGANGNAGQIFSYSPGGQCQVLLDGAGTNGLAIAPDGNLLGCRHGDQTLTIFDLETLEPSVFIADNQGAAFNSPNDVSIRSDGNVYFTCI